MLLTNKAYTVLKWIAQYLLPASGTLYFALASIWGFGYGEQIIGTITAIDVFLGVILGISSIQYKKTEEANSDGVLVIDESNPNQDVYRLELGENLETLATKKNIVLSVQTLLQHDYPHN